MKHLQSWNKLNESEIGRNFYAGFPEYENAVNLDYLCECIGGKEWWNNQELLAEYEYLTEGYPETNCSARTIDFDDEEDGNKIPIIKSFYEKHGRTNIEETQWVIFCKH